MSARYLAVHLPAFRLERCGYDADDIVALIAEEKSAMRLITLTPGARAAGLQRGMTVAQARSLVPDVQLDPLDLAEEARDRGELLRVLERLSDRVQAMGEQDFVAEVSRTSTALGGEPGVVERAVELAGGLGHRVSVAITDDPLAALALARYTPEAREVVPAGAMADALAPLPVTALQPTADLATSLRALGISCLGELAELDAASVSGRFGVEGAQIHRIASGSAALTTESVVAWVGDAMPRVSAHLAGATSSLQLAFVLPGLLAQLCTALADRDLAVVHLRCTLNLERPPPVTFGVRVGRPTRDVDTLERLVRTRLDGLRLTAPVEEWVIEVGEAVPEQGWQPGLTDRAEATEPLPDVLARLTDALGEAAVFAAEPVDTWRPEASWRPVKLRLVPPLRRPDPPSDDPVAVQERWETSLRWARPTQLLKTPEPIQVRVERGRPVSVLLEKGWAHVEACEGPECLSGEWWRPQLAWERSYWVVRIAGRSAWIFENDTLWFLHGWF
ncbi:MAG: DNA polymerase Y family protein [Alphaproteobacteria bacterium]|nr:DNA polymerase Y family protein [Alphaproteobacteria bacterium]